MPTLQQQISEKFLSKLAGCGEVDAAKIEKLRVLLSENKRFNINNKNLYIFSSFFNLF